MTDNQTRMKEILETMKTYRLLLQQLEMEYVCRDLAEKTKYKEYV